MKHQGHGVIRLGDKTSHGGTVIAASSGTTVMGLPGALAEDMTQCPLCKGTFPIKRMAPAPSMKGKRMRITTTFLDERPLTTPRSSLRKSLLCLLI